MNTGEPHAESDTDAWVVRRRWMPRLGRDRVGGRWRRHTKGTGERAHASMDLMDAGELAEVPFLGWIAMAAALIGIVVFLTVVLVPLLFALVDLLFLLLLALGGIAARVLFRRPWLVDAHHREGRDLRWRIVGWRASNAFAAEARELLAAGIVPPDAEELHPDPANPTDSTDPNHPIDPTDGTQPPHPSPNHLSPNHLSPNHPDPPHPDPTDSTD